MIELGRPSRLKGAGFYEYDEAGKPAGPVARPGRGVPGRRAADPAARRQGPAALRRGARDREVLRRGRDHLGRRGQHRLDHGHRLPAQHRRRGPVHDRLPGPERHRRPHRAGGVLRPGRRAGRRLRRAVPALGVPARPGRRRASPSPPDRVRFPRSPPGRSGTRIRAHDPETPGVDACRRGAHACTSASATSRPSPVSTWRRTPARRPPCSGRNGAGKSTTMRVLAGRGPADRRHAPSSPATTSARSRSRSSAPPATAPTWAAWCRAPPPWEHLQLAARLRRLTGWEDRGRDLLERFELGDAPTG